MRPGCTVTNRRGVTLIELLVAMAIFGVLMTSVLGMMRKQSEGFKIGNDRMSMLQNVRFSANLLEQDLRVLGANTPDEQPALIYAGRDVVAFSGDYASNIANDPFAVYYVPDAPNSEVMAATVAQRAALPTTSFQYPDTNYTQSGQVINSPAETIIFFFVLDSSTTRSDDYALFRSVNNGTSALVARNLLPVADGSPFFEYVRLNQVSGTMVVEDVPNGSLPLKHSVPIHLSAADTAVVALIDSIRAVRVNLRVTNGRSGANERFREISRLITLPNAGMAVRTSCGDTPILGVALSAVAIAPGGDPTIRLTWAQAIDEATGELDIGRYVIWRKQPAAPNWGAPFLSIPAGQPNYQYDDGAVVSGDQWVYALAAQDCTPNISSLSSSGIVVVP